MRKGDNFFELSNEGRQEIVEFLLKSPKRHTEIASELEMTPGEVTRNVRRLIDSSFIEKGVDTKYHVTKYGELLHNQLEAIDYLEKNQEFFNTHDLSCIPSEFISARTFSMTEIISGTPKVMSHIWKLTESSNKYIWSILEEPLRPMIDENINKAIQGVQLKVIIPDSKITPPEYVGIFGAPLEIRKLDEVRIYLKMNEYSVLLGLPDLNGNIDYSEVLFSNDPSFLNWGRHLFNYFWEMSVPV